ncbi:pyridoxal phosphate-dependent aminotransferase [Sphaerotilus montanus]|jgi:aspartate/methionine/tyrosine aminotransferase|uniref:Aminotransferase n=1 Tax=Sphaerotilus montanus TaxID=522889 RepID=A0A7Y9R112_9BURK|nr:pyridoxal phosphate-dependent aminotransferase [Sphaerotilus montanus]NYG34321.1 aspartate/methionine/tyrosine aminotransferase [Sphaerotilus montanus]NZD59308.1 pyridoxal phosphate-dependent aminotransferase [Sphaerotilus montanus]
MSLRPAPSKPDPLRLAQRVAGIEPFWVMECAKAADAIARTPACDPAQGGERMLYLNIGEPDETAPPAVVAAAQACLDAGRTQYTHAVGLPALRRALSGWYASRWGVDIDPGRIVVTAGASAALQLLCTALVEPGDEFLMPDPCYPCNRHFVTASGGTARLLPTTPAQRFQLDATSVADAWGPATRGVMLASPSNPTGTSVPAETLAGIVEVVRARGGITIVDEIYLGLSYDGDARTALALGDDVLVVNSFSKYFGMTGWRLGWLVLPEALVAPVEKLAQNLYICASAIAQQAALACFTPETLAVCEERRATMKARRDYIVPALDALGLTVPVQPDGAFYVWFDVTAHAPDSWQFCFDMMERAHVALTPGRDFGHAETGRYARLSFASSMDDLHEAVRRLQRVLGR